MSDTLVAYFSATGRTKRVALKLAELTGADTFEILPDIPYTKKDLNWMDKKSRTTVEMNDKSFRPAMAGTAPELSGYSTLLLGFPIWWYVAPTIINTFLESLDLSGKRVVLFATSGSSGFGSTLAELQPSAPGAELVESRVISGLLTDAKIRDIMRYV